MGLFSAQIRTVVNMISIKQKLNDLQKKSGYSLPELEQATGITHSTMRRMLDINDDSMPSFDNVVNVVIVLGGSIDELIGLKTTDASETPLTIAYNRIIEEKDAQISRLELAHALQRKEKYVVAAVLFAVIAVIAVILVIDFSNAGIGYVRY